MRGARIPPHLFRGQQFRGQPGNPGRRSGRRSGKKYTCPGEVCFPGAGCSITPCAGADLQGNLPARFGADNDGFWRDDVLMEQLLPFHPPSRSP